VPVAWVTRPVDDQPMAVLHEHVAPVAGQGWMGLGFAAQQGVRIDTGAMSLVAELDVAEVAFRTLPAVLGLTKTLARASRRGGVSPDSFADPLTARHATTRPAAGCHPLRSTRH
jgi:hypothetical protein